MLPPTFDIALSHARMLSPQVRELAFERKDGKTLEFVAGQWVSLILPLDSGEVRRSYSIASAPSHTPRFEIAVTYVNGGPGSSFLHSLEPGASLTAVGPQGFFTRPKEKTGPTLFVGTGTGVTPLRSMLADAITNGETRPLWLLFGVRTEADILYRAELDAIATAHPNVRAFYTLSRAPSEWTGRRGYVQDHVRELWKELEPHGAPHAYICGLQRMIGAVRDLLRKDMAIPREQVHSERYD